MAQGRFDLGGLTAVAILLALIVAGCGGGGNSSPASGTVGTTTGASLQTKAAGESGLEESSSNGTGPKEGEAGAASEAEGSGVGEAGNDSKTTEGGPGAAKRKKHPPLELPAGKPEEGPTEAQRAKVPTADLNLAVAGGGLTADNSCDGRNVSPAVEWGGIPSGTAELVLFVMNVKPVNGKLYFDWAVGGIDPSESGLRAGSVPKGAVVGRNSAGKVGYSLCPPGSGKETYVFALYAIPKSLSPRQGFDPLALRESAQHAAESVGLNAAEY